MSFDAMLNIFTLSSFFFVHILLRNPITSSVVSLPVLPQCRPTLSQGEQEKDLITAISSPRFFTGFWAPYLCRILRALIPVQKQSAFFTRAVSTVTVHIKAETVKLCAWVCGRECLTGVCACACTRGAQPDGHPTLVSLSPTPPPPPPPSPNPTLLTSAQPLNLRAASHARV